ncbi:hypothetical protein DSO57_1026786 [Entomophthora muscae]|uniref:Uncharacterized protein n=1 Tax=Entomophthora muscae TaxID=34485 RepID=A0ACC2T211_9FUNG|nr:hypothetical protein DSO57_1026786 [Entomophthora muscae]
MGRGEDLKSKGSDTPSLQYNQSPLLIIPLPACAPVPNPESSQTENFPAGKAPGWDKVQFHSSDGEGLSSAKAKEEEKGSADLIRGAELCQSTGL